MRGLLFTAFSPPRIIYLPKRRKYHILNGDNSIRVGNGLSQDTLAKFYKAQKIADERRP